jgi:hypothetical protein
MNVTFVNLTPASDEALDARAHEIADDLIGTCRSLHDFTDEDEIDNDLLMAKLYDLCFECDCCGWWADIEELNNEDSSRELCDECHEHDEEWGG